MSARRRLQVFAVRVLRSAVFTACLLMQPGVVPAQAAAEDAHASADYKLAPGDTVHIQVFQNQDLTLDTRVSENGTISFPLIGIVTIGGLSPSAAEQLISQKLEDGGFVKKPQVTLVPTQIHGNQVSVLGWVNRPGRYPLDTSNMHLSEILAVAGGIAPNGADIAILTGTRDGKPLRREVDIPAVFLDQQAQDDIPLAGGDVIYVSKEPMFYIYGEAQRPGPYRIERGMTVQQALATGGGPTPRGSEQRLRLNRRGPGGKFDLITPQLTDPVMPDDVIYVRESLF